MLETKQIAMFFESLREYEEFNIAWTSICAILNPTEQNTKRLYVAIKKAERLRIS